MLYDPIFHSSLQISFSFDISLKREALICGNCFDHIASFFRFLTFSFSSYFVFASRLTSCSFCFFRIFLAFLSSGFYLSPSRFDYPLDSYFARFCLVELLLFFALLTKYTLLF